MMKVFVIALFLGSAAVDALRKPNKEDVLKRASEATVAIAAAEAMREKLDASASAEQQQQIAAEQAASTEEDALPKRGSWDKVRKAADPADPQYPADRKIDAAKGLFDKEIANPLSSIVKNHDKAQIASLKEKGKIAEGFPDLTFVHIPKTGGDAFAMAATPLFPYGMNIRANLALNLMIEPKKQGANYCYFEQLPPKEVSKLYSKKVAEEAYEKREVFCAARNPFDRIVSEWYNCLEFGEPGNCGNECTAAGLNNWIETELTAFQKGDYLRDSCFLVPQIEYMEGPGACKTVLDFNNLERDFNALMQRHGYNLTLPAKDQTHRTFKNEAKCQARVTKDHLSEASVKLIEKVYERDLKELGPKFGWVTTSPVEVIKNWMMAPIKALTTAMIEEGGIMDTLPEPEAGHSD